MLSNEQCIEVAEKVWMWKRTEMGDVSSASTNEGGFKYPMWYPHSNDLVSQSYLIKEVNSWPGFGRTVEAMAPKWQLAEYYHKDDDVTRIGFVDKQLKFFPVIWDYSEPLEIIEALHLAALEAVNES